MWDLDGSTADAAQKVRDDVIFDLVLGEPREHGEQPEHCGFDLGRGTSGGEEGRFPVSTAQLGCSESGIDSNILFLVIHPFVHSFTQNSVSTHTVWQDFLLRAITMPWALAGGLIADCSPGKSMRLGLKARILRWLSLLRCQVQPPPQMALLWSD